jgi:nicotinamidase-related amidase
MLVLFIVLSSFAQKPSSDLLHPKNHTLVLIDMQGQMAFATKNLDITELRDNTAIVAGASKIFNIPTVLTIIAEKSFSGPVFPELREVYPRAASKYIERTTMNAWEDNNAHKAIVDKANKKIVFAGLWTSVCIGTAALSAISEGYEVYFITDACGDVSKEAHDRSIQRMIAAGAIPMTSIQYLLELQRDWARSETYKPVTDLIKKYGGAYGIGTQYAHEMLPKH